MKRVPRCLALALWVLAALPGCAVYRKCGLHGCPGDAAITDAVRALLDRSPALSVPNEIDVQTWDHVVYLYGLVNTEMERTLADAVAMRVDGVTRVVDLIGVSNGSR